MHAQQLSHTQRPQQALCLLTARKKKKNEQQEKQANPWAKRRDESKEDGMTCNRNQLLQQNAKSSPDKDRECLSLSKDQHAKSEPIGLRRQRFFCSLHPSSSPQAFPAQKAFSFALIPSHLQLHRTRFILLTEINLKLIKWQCITN